MGSFAKYKETVPATREKEGSDVPLEDGGIFSRDLSVSKLTDLLKAQACMYGLLSARRHLRVLFGAMS